MRKTIEIDGVKTDFEANAGTTMLYKRAFDKDVFVEISSFSNSKGEEARAVDSIERLAYIMNIQSRGLTLSEMLAEVSEENYYEWLCQFSGGAFINVLKEIVGLWLNQSKTTSKSKN